MQVFIMRHGEAELKAVNDSVRVLTQCGRDESRQIAAWLDSKSVNIERVLVSPYLRAEQTLQVVRGRLALPETSTTMPELAPDGDEGLVYNYLQTLAKESCTTVLLISHLPLVGYLVAELCPGESSPMFATSAVACVELDTQTGDGKLLWQISPSQLMAKV